MKNEAEAAEILARAKSGDRDALAHAVKLNEGLVFHALKRTRLSAFGYAEEDLLQEGRAKLTQAVFSFEPERGAKFSTYAFECLKNLFADLARKRPAETPLEFEEGSESEAVWKGDSPEAAFMAKELRTSLLFHPSLSDGEKKMLAMKLAGEKNKNIAKAAGKSPGSVDTAWCGLKKKLKKIMAEEFEYGGRKQKSGA